MKTTEQVAVLTALQKMVSARLKECRAEADAELHEAYDEDGVTKKALKLAGTKVGDFILTTEKEHWNFTDKQAFEEFALDYGFGTIRTYIKPECMLQAIIYLYDHLPEVLGEEVKLEDKWERYITNSGGTPFFLDTDLIIPGIEYVPECPKGTQVRGCKPDDVIPIVRQLGGVEQLLLGAPETEHKQANTSTSQKISED